MVPVGTDLPLPSSELAQLFSVESEQLAALNGPGGEVEEGGIEPHHPHPRGPQVQPQETEALAHPHLQGDNYGTMVVCFLVLRIHITCFSNQVPVMQKIVTLG